MNDRWRMEDAEEVQLLYILFYGPSHITSGNDTMQSEKDKQEITLKGGKYHYSQGFRWSLSGQGPSVTLATSSRKYKGVLLERLNISRNR